MWTTLLFLGNAEKSILSTWSIGSIENSFFHVKKSFSPSPDSHLSNLNEFADTGAAEDHAAMNKFILAAFFAEFDDYIDVIIAPCCQNVDVFTVGVMDRPLRIIHFIEPVADIEAVDINDTFHLEFLKDIFAGVA